MKKKIFNQLEKLESNDGKLKGGFVSLSDFGMKQIFGGADNTGDCSGKTNSGCTNSGNCSGSTNKASVSCQNTGTCYFGPFETVGPDF